LQEQLFDRNAAVVDRIRWQLQFELNAAHWPSHHDNVRQRIQQAFGRGQLGFGVCFGCGSVFRLTCEGSFQSCWVCGSRRPDSSPADWAL
jgi:hypothetical protein